MRRLLLVAIAALSMVAAVAPAAANRSPVEPAGSSAWGASLVTWQERWLAWAAGSSTNPTASEICGEKIGGVFYLNQTAELGTKHVQCRLRPGTRLLGVVSTSFTWPTSPDETDEELLADLQSFFDPALEDPRATLDGRSLANSVAASLRYSDVYTIPLEPGNAIAGYDPSLATATETRLASVGWWLRIKPLTPGRHLLVFSNEIVDVGKLEIKFHITVSGGGCRTVSRHACKT